MIGPPPIPSSDVGSDRVRDPRSDRSSPKRVRPTPTREVWVPRAAAFLAPGAGVRLVSARHPTSCSLVWCQGKDSAKNLQTKRGSSLGSIHNRLCFTDPLNLLHLLYWGALLKALLLQPLSNSQTTKPNNLVPSPSNPIGEFLIQCKSHQK